MSPVTLLAMVQDFAASPHGREASASGLPDWFLLGIAVAAVAASFVLCVRYFIHPGEHDPEHIKRAVLRDAPPRSRH